jgi:2-amino-4-hydroxy-6-hydroxymethyldihydropteridine diphosphokinase
MATLLVGLGSNQRHPHYGPSRKLLCAAIAAIADHPDFKLIASSRLYQTRPIGPKQPIFTNAALMLETGLAPKGCLEALQRIEHGFGRIRRKRWGARTLDLDILGYDAQIVPNRINWKKKSTLNIPHPELHQRNFVLAPLAEIAPFWHHPILHRSTRQLLFGSPKRGLFSAIIGAYLS